MAACKNSNETAQWDRKGERMEFGRPQIAHSALQLWEATADSGSSRTDQYHGQPSTIHPSTLVSQGLSGFALFPDQSEARYKSSKGCDMLLANPKAFSAQTIYTSSVH
jgi:hypothetical protein